MKTITLRNIPKELVRILRRKAREEGMSYSKLALKLLEQGAGLQKPKKPRAAYHDLDALAGTWSRSESAQFEKALRELRKIDSELWSK
ncbi:MAG: hypothetical protein HY717_03250 [Planctomycetes bacterium]|nr:hypothetical protein [Planctomycetota bacterium]